MANEQNLKPKPFTSENQPENAGRKKGSLNRSTVFKNLLKIKVTSDDLKKLKISDELADLIKSGKLSLHEAMALGQIQSAIKGNTKAFQEIQDSLYGKLTDKTELEVSGGLDVAVKLAMDEEYGGDRDD